MTAVGAEGELAGKVLWESAAWSASVLMPSPVVLEGNRLFLTSGYDGSFGIVEDPTGLWRDGPTEHDGCAHCAGRLARHTDFIEDILDVEVGHTVEDKAKRAFVAVIDQQHQSMIEKWAPHRRCCDDESRCK